MLARTELTAKELDIPDTLYAALLTVRNKLERGEYRHIEWMAFGRCEDDDVLYMGSGCHCVLAQARREEIRAAGDRSGAIRPLINLSTMGLLELYSGYGKYNTNPTIDMVTRALNSYLATGMPDWKAACEG
jgi:hypothetical protein